MPPAYESVHGLLLAAGSGRRMGTPKALLRDEQGEPYVARAVRVLRRGGCRRVTVVVGAAAEQVRRLAEDLDADVVHAADWADGMGASLRAGLASASLADAGAVLVTLVDLPDVGADVVRRVLAAAGASPAEREVRAVLARATYHGVPGHPVLLGRDHWAPAASSAGGDRGARDYLAENPTELVECGDLATGRDVDRPVDRPGDRAGDQPVDQPVDQAVDQPVDRSGDR